jgi:dihydroorotate dehydrogenase
MEETIMRGSFVYKKVYCSSGGRGFYGEGYWWHWFFKIFLLYLGAGLITKTITLDPREGNMKLSPHGKMLQWFPDCVKVYPWLGLVVNAVGLSNPGWHRFSFNFNYSGVKKGEVIVSLTTTNNLASEVVDMITSNVMWQSNVLSEVNLGCPNTGEGVNTFLKLGANILDNIEDGDGVIINVGPTANTEAIINLANHPMCLAISVCNTIPYDEAPGWLQAQVKPMYNYAPSGGGISGWPLLPFVAQKVLELRKAGITKPIFAGGGITRLRDIDVLANVGVSSVKLGTVSMLAPWKVQMLIWYANWRLRHND